MKKIIPLLALMAIAALTGAGCNSSFSEPLPGENQPATTTALFQTYKNGTYGFEFQYPSDTVFVTPNYALLEDKIVEIGIPQTDYPKTNFGDAAFSVSASFAKSLAACLSQNPPENGDGFKTKTELNGIPFYMTSSTGAGAGNRYNSKIYRTLSGNQTCLELNETIHTSVIDNYPPGTVTEVDKNIIQSRLDKMLSTFKFSQ